MARVTINDNLLSSVANAIRSKTSTTEAISPLDFAEKIEAIAGGGIENMEVDEFAFPTDMNTQQAGGVDVLMPFNTCPDITIISEKVSTWGVASKTGRDLISIMIVNPKGNLMTSANAETYNTTSHNTISHRGQTIAYDEELNVFNISAPSTNTIFKGGVTYQIIGIWQN